MRTEGVGFPWDRDRCFFPARSVQETNGTRRADSRVDRVTPLPSESPSGPAGSVNAMLKMVKLDIAKLQAAYDGKS